MGMETAYRMKKHLISLMPALLLIIQENTGIFAWKTK